MANYPSDIGNQSLDAIGWPRQIGDLEDGTREGNIINRAYMQDLMQLLRSAHWDFARKTSGMLLLADASGNTPNVGTLVPQPWLYEYAYPTDCMKARFVPNNYTNQAVAVPANNIQIPLNVPLTGAQSVVGVPPRVRPARFQVATDFNYPPQQGQDTSNVQGVSPQGRTVILTNVRNASLVYTALMLYPSVFDPLFRAALVAYIAAEVALPIWTEKDRKFGLQVRTEQINIVKAKVQEARTMDGNEGTYSSDIAVDWLNFRNSGGAWNGWGSGADGAGGGPGSWGMGWDGLSLPDGSTF